MPYAPFSLHRQEVLHKYDDLCIGTIEGETPEVIDPAPGDLSTVPYAEPTWLSPQFKSPYYNASHRALQTAMRKFVDEHVTPEAQAKEADGTYISQELIDKMAANNLIAMRLGPGKHLQGRGKLLGDIEAKDFDYFHDMIVTQELTRAKSRGFQDGNLSGLMISLTAIKEWANDAELKKKVTEECLSGKKFMCLAITEAFGKSASI
jgi:alkylation response protein AidB-like acyl-CoA dehydrogenase